MTNKYIYIIVSVAIGLVATAFWYNSGTNIAKRNKDALTGQIMAIMKESENNDSLIKEKSSQIESLNQEIQSLEKINIDHKNKIDFLENCIKANSFPCETADPQAISFLIDTANAGQADSEPQIGVAGGKGEISTNVENQIMSEENIRLMDKLGLSGCRFTNSHHYIKRIDISWYGYDYACDRGEAFQVVPPSDGWTVDKISIDKNMGDYVILKKDATRIIFAHTETSHKEGDVLSKNSIIGKTNLSGATSGMHLHVEIWHHDMNVSYEYALGQAYKEKEASVLLKDRGLDFSEPSPVYYFTHYDLGDPNQNDSSPNIGASGVDLTNPSIVNPIAITVDIRKKMGIKFGDIVILVHAETGKRYKATVHDEMNKRFRTGCIFRPGTRYCIKGDIAVRSGVAEIPSGPYQIITGNSK